MNPRTLAILEDVQRGLLYRDVAAKHGITTLHVGRLAKQHGVMRSITEPEWRTRKRPEARNPLTAAIVEDLRAGLPCGEVAAKYGKPRKAIWNIVFKYRIGEMVTRNSSLGRSMTLAMATCLAASV